MYYIVNVYKHGEDNVSAKFEANNNTDHIMWEFITEQVQKGHMITIKYTEGSI